MHTSEMRRIGAYGKLLCTTTVAQTGVWMAIQGVWSVTVFATLTELSEDTRSGTIASMALTGGAIIYGAYTNFTLTSGAVIAYRTKSTQGG